MFGRHFNLLTGKKFQIKHSMIQKSILFASFWSEKRHKLALKTKRNKNENDVKIQSNLWRSDTAQSPKSFSFCQRFRWIRLCKGFSQLFHGAWQRLKRCTWRYIPRFDGCKHVYGTGLYPQRSDVRFWIHTWKMRLKNQGNKPIRTKPWGKHDPPEWNVEFWTKELTVAVKLTAGFDGPSRPPSCLFPAWGVAPSAWRPDACVTSSGTTPLPGGSANKMNDLQNLRKWYEYIWVIMNHAWILSKSFLTCRTFSLHNKVAFCWRPNPL